MRAGQKTLTLRPSIRRLGDTVGRRTLLIIHFIGILLESLVNAANPSVPVFVLGCALRGALSGLWPALMSMIADLTRPEQRILAFGLVALGASTALSIVRRPPPSTRSPHPATRHHPSASSRELPLTSRAPAAATAVVGAVCFVAVTRHVLARHHADYRPFWVVRSQPLGVGSSSQSTHACT